MTPFIVYSLPRSRSAWCQHWFMSREGIGIGHDIGMVCNSLDAFVDQWAGRMNGTFETGSMFAWKVIRQRLPHLRVAVIRRPIEEVHLSLMKLGVNAFEELVLRDAMLDEIASQRGVFEIAWQDLDNWHLARDFYQHCTGEKFDEHRWAACREVNVQVDFSAVRRLQFERHFQIEAFKAEVLAENAKLGSVGWPGLN